ncbi:MAG TPA: methyltransferase domain-containing protein [Bryobacteraceae bacterium]|jgi:trans-aconitate 2-methyltransferase|nr:methyltransferase domain-containing protein [Bryobacteraceae bacterium]
MTEWNAELYRERSTLQQTMAAEVLASLELKGSERVLDVGCGDGRITAEIASRLTNGSVVGVDASMNMVELASRNSRPNLRFEVADARALPFQHEFDLAVSFNALHWIQEQQPALASIHRALKPGGSAYLRLVPIGPRKSIETVLEETRTAPAWSQYFADFRDPYIRLTPDEYCALARKTGFEIERVQTDSKSWDFRTRADFAAFGAVTMIEWTKRLPESLRPVFINDVLDRYRAAVADKPEEANTFKFYQMTIVLIAA